jgi:Carboxypeptidase regulatory-like domain
VPTGLNFKSAELQYGTYTPVKVTLGAIRADANAAMLRAGMISGTVTDAAGAHHGLEYVWVTVSSPSMGAIWGAFTAADGSYTVTGLAAGTDYQVCFYGSGGQGGSADATGYGDQCWQNTNWDTPTPVVVTLGATSAGINAALAGTLP